MRKLFYVMTVGAAFLALSGCQKEDSEQTEITPEHLLSQNPEYLELQEKCKNITREDIIAVLIMNGEKVSTDLSAIQGSTDEFKSTNEPDAIELNAQANYQIAYVNGIPTLVSMMRWQWDIIGASSVCAADYAGPDWIYHIRYYWMDINTGAINGIRTRGYTCVYDGTGSQDHCWCTQDMKIISILGKWYLYNKVTGEEIATGGYIPSNAIITNTVNKVMCE